MEKTKLHNIRLSTVVPGKMSPENTVYRLTNTDLAMKLHYLKGVYFFNKEASQGLTIFKLKEAMFYLLDLYYPVAGRIRRGPEDGRPFIKCNDSGVRIVEAETNTTIDEWAKMERDVSELAYSRHVLGPDLEYSPFVYVQFTWFKCGGFAVGLSWAHIIGNAFTASTFINTWGQIIGGKPSPQIPFSLERNDNGFQFSSSISKKPYFLKTVDPVGDHWFDANNIEMVTFSFHVSPKNLDQIISKTNSTSFQALVAIIWKSLAKVRGELGLKNVMICAHDSQSKEIGNQGNGQSLSTINVDFTVAEASVLELAKVVTDKILDERTLIGELVEGENKNSDVILYGATLTFVNLEEVNVYELELNGHKPILANYTMMGVGHEGVILVLQGPKSCGGRVVTMVLPDDEVVALKNELKQEWGINYNGITTIDGQDMVC